MTRLSALLAAAVCLLGSSLAAQPVEVIGAEGTPAGDLARQITARAQYLLIERDTVLPAGWMAPGDLIILDAEVRLAGEVRGDVAVLGGELFLRPGARIGGRTAVLGGEVYRSALATFGEIVEVPIPRRTVQEAAGDEAARRVRVIEPPQPPRVQLGGLFGLDFPTYDRVDGATLRAGGSARLGRTDPGATLLAWATLRTGRWSPGGGAELRVPLAEDVRGALRASRETHTNERWIRGDLANTAASLVLGNDLRDYYESDRLVMEISRPGQLAPIEGEWLWAPRAGLLLSRDRPLAVSTTWALFHRPDMRRPNRQAEPGTVASIRAGTATTWRGRTSGFTGDADVEWAPGGVGDFSFAQVVADGRWEMAALRTHRILVRGRAMVPLGSGGAPPQRWSLLGGPATLPTYSIAAFDGDHLGFVDTRYGIPLPQAEIPLLGAPELQLRSATGAAWRSGEPMPRWGQNLGVGLRFFLFGAEAWIDPATRGFRPTVSFALGLSDW